MNEMLFVDANIVMYAVGAEHPYRDPCTESLDRIITEQMPTLVSNGDPPGDLHRTTSLGLPDKARDISARLETIIPVSLSVTMADIQRARKLSERYWNLNARDLIHVAVMLENGISHILSTDTHFDQVGEVTRIDPRDFARQLSSE